MPQLTLAGGQAGGLCSVLRADPMAGKLERDDHETRVDLFCMLRDGGRRAGSDRVQPGRGDAEVADQAVLVGGRGAEQVQQPPAQFGGGRGGIRDGANCQ